MRRISILGATGSIGRQALDVVRRNPGRFQIAALVAHRDAETLFQWVREFRPQLAGLVIEPAEIPSDVKFCDWVFGDDCAERAASLSGVHDVLSAVVGIAGLPAALTALEHAERLLLANKESLVTGGALVMDRARALGKMVIPVDSEHSAIFQCMEAANGNRPAALWLTASGGPLRQWNKMEIEAAQKEDVLKHPTWLMGPKITVDCATMMNKGLEVIEAHHLFDMPLDDIGVLVHPQSVIHSMVEFLDGAVLSQMGAPDMRAPIAYALGYPERIESGAARLNLVERGALTFEPPDIDKFPCLDYAYQAQRAGGAMPVALNAANEVAVAAFLRGEIRFGGIARINDQVMQMTAHSAIRRAKDVYAADREARDKAERLVHMLR